MQRTITLYDHAPVRIEEHEWPTIASAQWQDVFSFGGDSESGTIHVRRHADGRHLVYGTSKTKNVLGLSPGASAYREERGGFYLKTHGELIETIKVLASKLGASHIAQQCIAQLPAVAI
jgi:hypothetical protein